MKTQETKSLNTIDGATLMSTPLRPLNFAVDTLLSQGLHILAGSPKVGKSWLALWLAVSVAKGEPIWGMRVWLYARLSRDEDEELNSLTNQRKIVYEYAVAKEYEIIGESFDDNISGMVLCLTRPGFFGTALIYMMMRKGRMVEIRKDITGDSCGL